MLVNRIFTKNDMMVERALDSLAERIEVQSGNVANVNTPGYTRQVVNFEDALAEAYEASPRYLPDTELGQSPAELQLFQPRREADPKAQRLDGNGVSPETEMSELVQATIAFNALTRRTGWSTLKQIIQSSK